MLQQSTWTGSYDMFKQYTAMVDEEQSGYLRSLMDFNYPENGVPIDEVESVDEIVKRFKPVPCPMVLFQKPMRHWQSP